ncbi:MAG: GNAT family N-acetyltransferase [Vicingaceae bacterium]
MSELIIRPARKEDIRGMLKLIKELAEFEHGLNQVTVTEDELLKDGFGANPIYQCIVAEAGTQLSGIAVYFYSYSTWNGKCLYLEDLIVSKDSRFGGVGSKLMTELIRIAQKEKVKRMSWQVLDWNLDAQDFYRKFEAQLDSEWLNGRLDEDQINNFKTE